MKRLLVAVLLLAVAGCATNAPPPISIPAGQPAIAPPPPPPPPPVAAPAERAASSPQSATADQAATGDTAHMVVAIDLAAVERDKLDTFREDMRHVLASRNVSGNDAFEGQDLVVHFSSNGDAGASLLETLCTPGAGEARQFTLTRSDADSYTVRLDSAYRGRLDRSVFDQVMQHLVRKLDSFAPKAPVARPSAPNAIAVDLPDYHDLDRLRRLFGPTRVDIYLIDDAPPEGSDHDVVLPAIGGSPIAVARVPLLPGVQIAWVRTGTDPYLGMHELKLTLDAGDAKRFAAVTGENTRHRIAFVQNGRIVVAAMVVSAIPNGEMTISAPDAQLPEMLRLLGNSVGPAPLKIVDLELTNGGGQKLSTLTR
ncbi:MAG TPA: hypothetical protein VGF56_17410 [Rhizomicrobium sp.]